jgi:hypothetical protein
MSAVLWIVVAIVVVVAIFFIARRLVAQGRRRALQTRFGPEYDRALRRHGNDRDAAEAELADVVRERSNAQVRPLTSAERASFTERWNGIQAAFVESPLEATRDAESLVGAVLRTRGYPAADADAQLRSLVADYPEQADGFRSARATTSNAAPAEAGQPLPAETTERLRASLIAYRDIFEKVAGPTDADGPRAPERARDEAPDEARDEAKVRDDGETVTTRR